MDNKQGDIIQAVEQCLRRNGCSSCENCPYTHVGDGFECREKLRDDIIALLKAQEPRVMTLEELDDLRGRGQAVYYQDRDATVKSQDAFFVAVNCGAAWFKGETYMFCKTADGYDKVWRCWTSRPTDAQREATPWSN